MGITISHKLGIPNKQSVIKTLNETEKVAGYYQKEAENRKIAFNIHRTTPTQLLIDIGNCETLSFNFKNVAELEKLGKANWYYTWEVLTDGSKRKLEAGYEIEKYPQNEMFYTAEFCKTQFCKDLWEHKAVAELIRFVAGQSSYAEVNDEADYYYSGDMLELGKNIHELGQMINGLGNTLLKKWAMK